MPLVPIIRCERVFGGNGDLIKVQTALENEASPNAKDNDGRTPLHEAAFWGGVEIVKLLLERGADPLIADNDWLIPLKYARDSAIRSLLESATRNNELRDSFGLTNTTLKPNLRA